MSRTQPPPTRRRLLVLVTALVAVPILALSFFVYDLASDTNGALLHAVVPALVGAAIGAMTVSLPSLRSARIEEGSRAGQIASLGIVIAALVGGFGSHLPGWLNSGVTGWAVGFFVAFDVLLLRLWRNEPEFRKRIEALRSTTS